MESPSPADFSAFRWKVAGALFLIVAGLAAYSNSFSTPFVLDDTVSVIDNPSIRRLWPVSDVLRPPDDAGVGGRPLANLSFALNYAIGGTAVRGYHVVNLAIHLAASLTLFALTRRLLGAKTLARQFPTASHAPIALVVALVWSLHPLQTEAVTYVSQRTESLMGFCYLLTLYALVRLAEHGQRRWFAAGVVACLCGMATKEVMVTVPVIALLLDRTFLAGSFREAWKARRWFYFGLAATWLVLVFHLSGITQRGVTYATVTWWRYAFIESGALLHYLRLALWPAPLVFDYGADLSAAPATMIAPALLVVALLVATGVALWRWPVAGFVGAWFFILLAPTSSIIPIAGQPMAEHRMYLPLAALIAGLALTACQRFGRNALFVAAALAVLGGFFTYRRNQDYRTVADLWRDTIAKQPNSGRAHASLGAALLREKNFPAAIAELERALQLEPNDAMAHNNLATALQDTGRPADAIAHYRGSLKLEPASASTHYNIGNALLDLGRPAEAIVALEQAVRLAPTLAVAHAALANAFVATNRAAEAAARYTEALRLDPNLMPAHFAFANLLANSRQFADAIPHYEATLRAFPDSPEVHFNLATMYALTGRNADALQHYETTLRLKPNFPGARENLEKVRAVAAPVLKP